jgi:DNA polymerase III alpha subunit
VNQGLRGQDVALRRARFFAASRDVPTVVTNPAHYLDPQDASVLDLLHAHALGLNLGEITERKAKMGDDTDQLYLKSQAEIEEMFTSPVDRDAILRTAEVADRCHVDLKMKKFHFPKSNPPEEIEEPKRRWRWLSEWFPPPKSYRNAEMQFPNTIPDGWSLTDAWFSWYARSGLEARFEEAETKGKEIDREAYRERLEGEIVMIQSMGFSAYLLIVAEFINWAKDNGVPVGPGRGSVAGSLVAWAMRITEIDSIRFGLLFERFLNPARCFPTGTLVLSSRGWIPIEMIVPYSDFVMTRQGWKMVVAKTHRRVEESLTGTVYVDNAHKYVLWSTKEHDIFTTAETVEKTKAENVKIGTQLFKAPTPMPTVRRNIRNIQIAAKDILFEEMQTHSVKSDEEVRNLRKNVRIVQCPEEEVLFETVQARGTLHGHENCRCRERTKTPQGDHLLQLWTAFRTREIKPDILLDSLFPPEPCGKTTTMPCLRRVVPRASTTDHLFEILRVDPRKIEHALISAIRSKRGHRDIRQILTGSRLLQNHAPNGVHPSLRTSQFPYRDGEDLCPRLPHPGDWRIHRSERVDRRQGEAGGESKGGGEHGEKTNRRNPARSGEDGGRKKKGLEPGNNGAIQLESIQVFKDERSDLSNMQVNFRHPRQSPKNDLQQELCKSPEKNGTRQGRITVSDKVQSYYKGLVWDLTVDECHEYYAGGVLVSNSSMPDVDVDFGQVRREEVIEHVKKRYGAESVGQIVTYGTLKTKSAFKTAARSLGIHYQDADRWSKYIGEAETIPQALQESDVLRALYEHNPMLHRVLDLTAKIQGLICQWGVHAAGVVITPGPMSDHAPVHILSESTGKGGKKTKKQVKKWVLGADMKAVDDLGVIKFDFLGLKTLDMLRQAQDLVHERTGVRPDLDDLPLDDEKTVAMLREGDTQGLFQVESHGMQGLVRRIRPDRIDDVIAILALYRPGPLQSGMVDDYIERKHGRAPVDCLHPSLAPALEPTYGVMVYQEQVMQVARILAGYSLGEADLLRRAMGKKIAEEMAAQRQRFLDGAERNGVQREESGRIFDLIKGFAEYGFNKCLTGDMVLSRAGANQHQGDALTVQGLYQAYTSKKNTPYGKKLLAGRARILQLCEDNRIRPGFIKAIYYNGMQPVYEVRTKANRFFRGTLTHRLMGENGYTRISDLKTGDTLITMDDEQSWPSTWSKGRSASLDQITSIPYLGMRDTYDIEMAGPDHNFIANGFVSHNSHSAAYGMITWQTAWLKAHHRAEFMAAALTWEGSQRDKLQAYVYDCRRAKIEVMGPDINKSRAAFHVESDSAIRYGLGAINGLGSAALTGIDLARQEGVFTDVKDFLTRTKAKKVTHAVFANLCSAGGFDALQPRRDLVLAEWPQKPKEGETVETGLWTWSDRMAREQKALGMWLTGHPLDRYGLFAGRGDKPLSAIGKTKAKRPFRIVGTILRLHRITTKTGKKMVFITLSSKDGYVEVSCFPEAWSRYGNLLQVGASVLLKGAVDRDGPGGRYVVEGVESLDELRRWNTTSVEIALHADEVTRLGEEIAKILQRHRIARGNSGDRHAAISVEWPDGRRAYFRLDKPLDARPELFLELERATGRIDSVRAS